MVPPWRRRMRRGAYRQALRRQAKGTTRREIRHAFSHIFSASPRWRDRREIWARHGIVRSLRHRRSGMMGLGRTGMAAVAMRDKGLTILGALALALVGCSAPPAA